MEWPDAHRSCMQELMVRARIAQHDEMARLARFAARALKRGVLALWRAAHRPLGQPLCPGTPLSRESPR